MGAGRSIPCLGLSSDAGPRGNRCSGAPRRSHDGPGVTHLKGLLLIPAALAAIAAAYWFGGIRERMAADEAARIAYPWDLQRRSADVATGIDCRSLRTAASHGELITRALDPGTVAVIGYDMVTQQISITLVDRGQRVVSERRRKDCP